MIQGQRRAHNRLGIALQVCALRYLGFVPARLHSAPPTAIGHLARQLCVKPQCLAQYGERSQTRTGHLQEVLVHLDFRKARPSDLRVLKAWLIERALEHDRPTLLFQLAFEKLHTDKIVRPGLTCLERLALTARQEAQNETFRPLTPLLSGECKNLARRPAGPRLLKVRENARLAPPSSRSNSPKAIGLGIANGQKPTLRMAG